MSEHSDHTDPAPVDNPEQGMITRRRFLRGSSAAVASTGLVTAAAGVITAPSAAQDATPAAPAASTPMGEHTMPLPPGDSPVEFFTVPEAQTVDAITGRILPGTANDPGAREAGAVYYIDRTLSGTNFGLDLKTYTQGPFLGTSEEPVTVEASSVPDVYRTVFVAEERASRYGYQSVLTPQQMYRRGIAFVNAYAQSQFGQDFIDLTDQQQDSILTDMEADKASGFDGPTGSAFFTQLRNDTIEGTFSDPMYGGNRDLVGWKLIGYPGAQRLYTAEEIKSGTDKQPISLMQLIENESH